VRGGYSRRVLRHSALEEGQVLAVLIVQPLDFKVQVHIIGALTEAVLLVLWEREREQMPGHMI